MLRAAFFHEDIMQIDDDGRAPANEAAHDTRTTATATADHDSVSLADEHEADGAKDAPVSVAGRDAIADARDDSGADDTGDKPRKRSQSQRYRDRIARLSAELEAERRRANPPAAPAGDDDLVEPRQADFADDYLAYDRALRDYQIRRALRDERRRDAEIEARADAATAMRERLAGYHERLAALKERIPDFDDTLRAAAGIEVRDDVRDLILGSSKGPLLAYYLARNPDALDDINRLPPIEAARRIGNLEARIRGANPVSATNAKAPVTPPRGGASAPRALDPERMSHAEYRKARADGQL
jgi:hypothetical protein